MSGEDKDLPALPTGVLPSDITSRLNQWREALQKLLGTRGDPKREAVRWEDLIDGGLADVRRNISVTASGGAGGVGPIGPQGPPGESGVVVPDLTMPPTPTGLVATAGFGQVIVQWDAPIYTAGHGHKQTNLYATKQPADDPTLYTINDAVRVDSAQGALMIRSIASDLGIKWRFWIKWESSDGIESDPAGGVNGVVVTTGKIGNTDLGPLIVQAANLAAGAVTAAKFDAAIEPVTLYTSGSLPTTKSTSTIFYGGKLYRWSGTAYVATVPTTDLTGTVADAQIAGMAASKVTGTLTDAQLAAISAAKITGQIVGTQITDGAVTTAKIFAGSITTAKIAADAVTSNEIAAGAVTASEIAAGAVTTAKLAAGAVTANEIAAGAIIAGKIAADAITATELAADAVTAGKIAAGAITASKLSANAIAVGTAAIQNGAIVNAMLGNAVIDDAKVANLSAAKLTAGDGTIGGSLKSGNYSSTLNTGWIIRTDGSADFNNIVIRGATLTGTIYASAGTIGGITIASGYMRAGQLGFDNGSGFYLGSDGRFSVGSSSGNKLTWDGGVLNIVGGGTFSGALAAATVGAGGVTIGSSGNIKGGQTAYDTGTGFWMGYDSTTYKFSIKGAGGQGLTFDGTNLLITGSFTASAVDAVNTVNIAGDALIVPLRGEYYAPRASNIYQSGFTAVTFPVVNFAVNGRVVLLLRWFVHNEYPWNTQYGGFRIYEDGSTLVYDTGLITFSNGGGSTDPNVDTPMFSIARNVSAGSRTYSIWCYGSNGQAHRAAQYLEMTLISVKK